MRMRRTQRVPDPRQRAPGLRGGSRRVFKPFARLGAGSGKMALSHPTHQPRSAGSSTGNAHRSASAIELVFLLYNLVVTKGVSYAQAELGPSRDTV